MKKIKTIGILAVLSGVLLMGCSRNAAPPAISAPFQSAPVYVQSDCDSSVQAAVAAVEKVLKSKDTTGCAELLCSVVELTAKLNTSDKRLVELKEKLLQITAVPVTVFTGKVKNSFNDVQKNSNNSTEITKLKNALQIRGSQFDSVSFANISLNGKIKDLQKEITRNKNSSSGENSPNTAKSGNSKTSAPWFVWVIVFCCGGITFKVVPMLVKKALPAIGSLSFVKKLLT